MGSRGNDRHRRADVFTFRWVAAVLVSPRSEHLAEVYHVECWTSSKLDGIEAHDNSKPLSREAFCVYLSDSFSSCYTATRCDDCDVPLSCVVRFLIHVERTVTAETMALMKTKRCWWKEDNGELGRYCQRTCRVGEGCCRETELTVLNQNASRLYFAC